MLFRCGLSNFQVFGDFSAVIDLYAFYSFKFVRMCFMAKFASQTLLVLHVNLRRIYILPLLDVDNYIQLIDAVVKFSYFLTDLLPAVSVHF